MPVQLGIVTSGPVGDHTEYSILVNDNGQQHMVQKRYRQFVELDEQLATVRIRRRTLPEKGLFGIRAMLNLNGFNEDRLQGLQLYLAQLAMQLNSIGDCPPLAQWLASNKFAGVQAVAQPAMAQGASAQPGAYAAQPTAAQPGMMQPGVPVALQPVVAQPVATPVAAQPVSQFAAAQACVVQPAATQPVSEQSATTQPAIAEQAVANGTAGKRVQAVLVRSGSMIDQISFFYSDGSRDVRGDEGGVAHAPFPLQQGEFLTTVKGRQGDSLDAVQFVTNLGRESPLYGQSVGGTHFELHASPGMQIWSVQREDGFCGRVLHTLEMPRGSPLQAQAPVQGMPMQEQVPIQGVPLQGQVPVQGAPMPGPLPACGVPLQGQVPVQGVPVQGQVPVHGVPMQGQVPVQGVPVYGQSPVQAQPMQGQCPTFGAPHQGLYPAHGTPVQGQFPMQAQGQHHAQAQGFAHSGMPSPAGMAGIAAGLAGLAGIGCAVAGMGGGHSGGHGGGVQPCFKCEGRGFCHESSMRHNAPHGQKCFLCATCTGCHGTGHIAEGASGAGIFGMGGGFAGNFGMGAKQPCFKCEGRGFCHDSSMPHDKPHDEKCFFCKHCSGCHGTGAIGGGGGMFGGGGRQACFKCHGHGFCHESSMDHDAEPGRRCFFCKDCTSCHGTGAI